MYDLIVDAKCFHLIESAVFLDDLCFDIVERAILAEVKQVVERLCSAHGWVYTVLGKCLVHTLRKQTLLHEGTPTHFLKELFCLLVGGNRCDWAEKAIREAVFFLYGFGAVDAGFRADSLVELYACVETWHHFSQTLQLKHSHIKRA